MFEFEPVPEMSNDIFLAKFLDVKYDHYSRLVHPLEYKKDRLRKYVVPSAESFQFAHSA